MSLKNKRILTLLAPEFEDLEFWVPAMRMIEEGAVLTIAGSHANEVYYGKTGISATSDLAFKDIDPAHYDAVLIPGGWAPDKLRRYDEVKMIIKEMYISGKIIGMICHAGLVGISAGIVKGHQVTGSIGIKDDLINAGAEWVDLPAVRSGNLIWGRVVADIPYYCKELVKALE